MRIGELAELAGISTRAIRHYHRLGLLPEPDRVPGGYRAYELRHAVLLLRIRRLVELGSSLDQAGELLAGDADRDLHEILAELDADLAEAQRRIGLRRQRIAELLANASAPDFSAHLADVLTDLERVSSVRAVPPGQRAVFAELATRFVLLRGRAPDDPLVEQLADQAAQLGREVVAMFDVLRNAASPDPAQARCFELLLQRLSRPT